MPKFVIEREIPGSGARSPQQVRKAGGRSRAVLRDLGPEIQWLTTHRTDDRRYCVYIAPGPHLIKEPAARGGFPGNRVSEVRGLMDPARAEVP